jgi:hypothetical protein
MIHNKTLPEGDEPFWKAYGYTAEEWRLKMQNEQSCDPMWDMAAYESCWTEFDTDK